MNGIIGMTEVLCDTQLNDQQHEYLGMVKQSADSLLRLVNDILDFSKVEAGMLELEEIDFPLLDRLENTIQTLGANATRKSIELALQLAPDVPERLVGDPGRLCQIILNLVGNAIKFTHEGEIVVSVEVQSRTDNQVCLKFNVRDTGIGISEADQRRIFDAFSQADSSMSRRFGGTGLGLAISSQLVNLMQGTISVESDIGAGTTFTFTAMFPLAAQRLDQTPPPMESLKEARIGVSIKNPTTRDILIEMLRAWGLHPAVVKDLNIPPDNSEGRTSDQDPLNLLLFDPGHDPNEAIRLLSILPRLDQSKLVLFRSIEHVVWDERFKQAGATRILTKPFKRSLLHETILEVLSETSQRNLPIVDDTTPQHTVKPLRILLAEDNAVNQHVAMSFLNHHGHEVTLANNGTEAIALYSENAFDLVLMDVQMPEMNGFEATAHIREFQRTHGFSTPIIAMTAYAMQGDRQRCLDAGMDDYISKPIKSASLHAMIAKHAVLASVSRDFATSAPRASGTSRPGLECNGPGQMSPRPKSTSLSPSLSIPSTPPILATVPATESTPMPAAPVYSRHAIDWDAARQRYEDCPLVITELGHLFVNQCPELLDDIEAALKEKNVSDLMRAAHSLKGSADAIAATQVVYTATQLERMGHAGDLPGITDVVRRLRYELSEIASLFPSNDPIEANHPSCPHDNKGRVALSVSRSTERDD
jgi:CheY-like chemotaxis protein/HPt (histidine-containing phosphotransfer) domain-containing protein/two-component sensor histidine kinase